MSEGKRHNPAFDVCECGDYRHQHDDHGVCKLNGLGHGGAPACFSFSLSEHQSQPGEPK